jgi:hypothetical protein
MATKTETYEIVLAHGGRTDDTVVETVTITSKKAYNALCDRIFGMNQAIGSARTMSYYGIRRAA